MNRKLTNHGGGIGDGGKAADNAEDGEEGQEEQAGHHLVYSVVIIKAVQRQESRAETEIAECVSTVKLRGVLRRVDFRGPHRL